MKLKPVLFLGVLACAIIMVLVWVAYYAYDRWEILINQNKTAAARAARHPENGQTERTESEETKESEAGAA